MYSARISELLLRQGGKRLPRPFDGKSTPDYNSRGVVARFSCAQYSYIISSTPFQCDLDEIDDEARSDDSGKCCSRRIARKTALIKPCYERQALRGDCHSAERQRII